MTLREKYKELLDMGDGSEKGSIGSATQGVVAYNIVKLLLNEIDTLQEKVDELDKVVKVLTEYKLKLEHLKPQPVYVLDHFNKAYRKQTK
jgi:hypothetical protein